MVNETDWPLVLPIPNSKGQIVFVSVIINANDAKKRCEECWIEFNPGDHVYIDTWCHWFHVRSDHDYKVTQQSAEEWYERNKERIKG